MTVSHLLPPGDYVSDYIRAQREPYELTILRELAERLQDGSGTIIDAGAHIGNHACWLAARLPSYQVEAFEPWPTTFKRLAANARGRSNLRAQQLALSSRSGRLRLGRVDGNAGHVMTIEPDTAALQARVVRCEPIDSLGLLNVRLIKVDVEGHEAQVLAGARQTIERDRPLICVEDWTQVLPRPAGYRVAVDWLDLHQAFLWEYASGA